MCVELCEGVFLAESETFNQVLELVSKGEVKIQPMAMMNLLTTISS